MRRRDFLALAAGAALAPLARGLTASQAEKFAAAARAQVGITTGYDPKWTKLAYPGGDVSRSTGVCADVVIRAARDGLNLDLQRLVHEDMAAHFSEYPAYRAWRATRPDANIDHRRVLNLETYFERSQACLWRASRPTAGDGFPLPLRVGDTVTWLLDARLPHIAVVVQAGDSQLSGVAAQNRQAHLVHNIGGGAEEVVLAEMHAHRAIGHYRWPKSDG